MHLSGEMVDTIAGYLTLFILFFVPMAAAAGQANQYPFDLISLHNERLANRVGLHLALGGGFEPPPTP